MATTEKKKDDKKKKSSSKRKESKKLEKAQQAFSVPHIAPEEITLKGLLGKGCFGKVFAGECRSIEVAVKVPKKQNLSKRALRNFCKEVEIMRLGSFIICIVIDIQPTFSTVKFFTQMFACLWVPALPQEIFKLYKKN